MWKYKIIILFSFFISLLLVSSCNRQVAQSKTPKQYFYSCPMHPDDIYYLPGKCSKCGMTFEAWEMGNMPNKKSSNSHSGHLNSGSSAGGCH